MQALTETGMLLKELQTFTLPKKFFRETDFI